MERIKRLLEQLRGGGMRDSIKITGKVRLVLRDEDGKVLIDRTHRNLVVNTGKYHIADKMADMGEAAMSHMAIGTGTTAAAAGDTALVAELDRNALDSGYPQQGTGSEANKVTYQASWAAGDGTGAITEAGIFNSLSAGVMLCRTKFDVINKGASHTLTLTWVLTISA